MKKYIINYNLDISHFDRNINKKGGVEKYNLEDILIESSAYSRTSLKKRLFKNELLNNICCLCGQDENWHGTKISLILDHINGIHNDNRIEKLRIVCPNCNAGLDTFAGKNLKHKKQIYYCKCGNIKYKKAINCTACHAFERRTIERPPIDMLKQEIDELGYLATGRKYGVSDNTIRKWLKK